MNTGDRVRLEGRVAFVRSGFAKVYWDNGAITYEWVPDLRAATDSPQPAAASGQATDAQ